MLETRLCKTALRHNENNEEHETYFVPMALFPETRMHPSSPFSCSCAWRINHHRAVVSPPLAVEHLGPLVEHGADGVVLVDVVLDVARAVHSTGVEEGAARSNMKLSNDTNVHT